MNIKLVVADVDGTLLNARHELTEFTRITLLALQKAGIRIILATGKILPSISEIVKELNLGLPLILANGALIQRTDGTVLYETPLPPQHFTALLDFVSGSDLDYALFTCDQVFVPHHTYNTDLVVEYNDPQPIEIGQMDLSGKIFYKFIVLERKNIAKLDHLGNLLNKKFAGLFKAYRSVPGMLEVFNAQTSKSVAVQKLATYLDLNMQQVIVIGDSYNDIDMFRTAGIAVAMGNAPDAVKREAQLIIGTNDEDGVAQFISKFFAHLFR